MNKQFHIDSQQRNLPGVLDGIRNGVDINQRNFLGETPLSKASQKGNASIVKALLEAGADPNIPKFQTKDLVHTPGAQIINIYADTPLTEAAGEGHLDVV